MSGDFIAAADVITGAAIARAVEPSIGEGLAANQQDCLNCGAVLTGAHCHRCGQKAEVHRTLSAFWHDFTHSILHFEGKIWRTLPMLAVRPGQLTRRYVQGERAKFVSPLALFLFSVFLMFAAISGVGLPIQPKVNTEKVDRQQIRAELARAKVKVASLEAERANVIDGAELISKLDAELLEAQSEVSSLEVGARLIDGITIDDLNAEAINIDSGYRAFDDQVRSALKDPKLLLYKVQSNAYKFSWALVLLSIPFVWLVFAWRRQFRLFDHAVFVTYSLCFMSLLLVFMTFLTKSGLGGLSEMLFILAPPTHMFFQLRGAYGLTLLGAAWRTLFLMFSAIFVLLSFALILLGLGVSG